MMQLSTAREFCTGLMMVGMLCGSLAEHIVPGYTRHANGVSCYSEADVRALRRAGWVVPPADQI